MPDSAAGPVVAIEVPGLSRVSRKAVSPASGSAVLTATLHEDNGIGEIYMIAVDPDAQNQGIGEVLADVAIEWLRASGMRVALVETGGDNGHAPARRVYEKAGYTALPAVRYFKAL